MAEKNKGIPTFKRTPIIIFVIGFLFVIMVGGAVWSRQHVTSSQGVPTPTLQQNHDKVAADIFRYSGKEGVDALTLLKQQTSVEQNSTGLVTAINKRKADASNKEYWSFFVNGKMAEVGPADYLTKDSDQIEWRIETY